ncbi:acyltransferase family protein [Modestobacter sp. I12A-02662]|uniref:acyltransferase family protein n=1 Tax=Modestobacter sp. I12A-02662 TaxID=1730496 RepID=UPI0034DEDC26
MDLERRDEHSALPLPRQHAAQDKVVAEFGYKPALDGLRGAAAIAVLYAHVVPDLLPGGDVSLYLFFALSGYLITGLLLTEISRNGTIDLPRFYGRRAIRLLPAILLVLAAVAVLTALTPTGPSWTAMAAVLFYVGNWYRAFGGELGTLTHTWSLSVEEQFYLVWPLVCLAALAVAVRRRADPARVLAWVTAAGCVLALGIRVLLVDGPTVRIYNGTDTRIDFILYGCLLSCLIRTMDRERLARWLARAFPVALLVALAWLVFHRPQQGDALMWTVGYTVIAVSSTVIVGHLGLRPDSRAARPLKHPALIWLGKMSYGFYLWHFPILAFLRAAGVPVAALAVLGLVLSVGMAWASFRLVEAPISRRLYRRLAARPQ